MPNEKTILFIVARDYDDEGTRIEKALWCKHPGFNYDNIPCWGGDVHETTREQIVTDIKGLDFGYRTRFLNKEGIWEDGAEILPYEVRGTEFLKTERNDKEEDNLGELPTIEEFNAGDYRPHKD